MRFLGRAITGSCAACMAVAMLASPATFEGREIEAADGTQFGGGPTAAALQACFAPGTDRVHADRQLRQLRSRAGAADFVIVDRWTQTATNGSVGDGPITLTFSFVPDVSTGNPATSNSLHAALDAQFGSRSAWQNLFREIFADWSQQCGIQFVETVDDGASWPGSPGAAGVRGDVRIVAQPIDGVNNTLAFNYFPNAGDMTLDTAENWANPSQNFRFLRNTLMHELGHGIGLDHVDPIDSTKLMEAFLNTNFAGPQDDDVRGAQNMYGDAFEPNATVAAAANLGAFVHGNVVSELSLHESADVDYYRINAAAGTPILVTAAPVGATYMVGPDGGTVSSINTRTVQALRIRLWSTDGSVQIADSSATAGNNAAATAVVLSGESSLLIQVLSAGGSNNVQRYTLTFANGTAPDYSLTVNCSAVGVVGLFSPPDQNSTSSAPLPTTLTYSFGQTVAVTAPSGSGAETFVRWILDGVPQTLGQNPLSVLMLANHAATAQYSDSIAVEVAGDNEIDVGQSTVLTVLVAGGSAPYSYSWSPVTGLSNATAVAPTASPTTTTTYTVTVTDSANRSGSAQFTLNVTQPLTCNAGPDRTLVVGSVATMQGSATGGHPPYTFQWSPVTGLADGSSATSNLTVLTARTYTLTVADSDGHVASDSVSVALATPLQVSLPSSVFVVAGLTATLTPTISGGVTPYAIQWTPLVGSANAGGVLTFQAAATDAYTITVQDAIGQARSASTTVTVVPVLQASVSASSTTVSSGGSIELAGSVNGGMEPISVSWSPASFVALPTALSTSATPATSTTFTLTATDAIGQSATAGVAITVGSIVTGQGGVNGGAAAPMLGPCGLVSFTALALLGLAVSRGARRQPSRRE